MSGDFGRLSGQPFEDVIDEGVHDRHRLLGNADVRMNLLQHLVDETAEMFATALLDRLTLLATALSRGLGGLRRNGNRGRFRLGSGIRNGGGGWDRLVLHGGGGVTFGFAGRLGSLAGHLKNLRVEGTID